MAFAQGSRSSLSYIVESTYGVTPAGNFQNLPHSTHSLNLSKTTLAGTDLQADRMPRVSRHGNRQVGGDIVADLRHEDYDSLLESAMLNTWSTDVLTVGTTPKSFTIEDYAAYIDQARLFPGCMVSTLGVSIAPDQMVTTTFGMVGKDMSISATEKTQDAASVYEPFDSYTGSIKLGNQGTLGSALAVITGVDFTLTNTFAPNFVVGSQTTPSLQYGRAEVEGTIVAHFEDETLINRFINETSSALQVIVGDPAGNTMTFDFPHLKINTADAGVDGPTARLVNMSFVGIYDSTTGTNMKITRS
jgi:hypothetical protein